MIAALALAMFLTDTVPRPPRTVTPAESIAVPILVYHSVAPHHRGQTKDQRYFDVDPTAFEGQLDALARERFTVVPFAALVDALDGRSTLPPRAVVLTFDDGWETQYRHAFPILKSRGLPATFFVFTNPIGRDPQFMTWTQLKEMAGAGMTIAAHTRTHPELKELDRSFTSEIAGSRDDITRALGSAPQYFAYPFCRWDQRAIAAVRKAGFRAARSCDHGQWNGPADRYALNAVIVTDDSVKFERVLRTAVGQTSPRVASRGRSY
jgi:peptidoglycan/xylan/chitin deacetylase (PgdA/CDA1 family)